MHEPSQHSRQARATLRVLRDDITANWDEAWPQRALANGNVDELRPVAELPHPLIRKARECISNNAAEDSGEGPIRDSRHHVLEEVKVQHWRGGVWHDEKTGTNWLVVAGIAKGGHRDHDDFYERVRRASADEADQWLPTEDDLKLLKTETAARLLRDWKLEIQNRTLRALESISTTQKAHPFDIPHPVRAEPEAIRVELTLEKEDDAIDVLVVTIDIHHARISQDLGWEATLCVLNAANPPMQDWDAGDGSYASYIESAAIPARIKELHDLDIQGLLAESSPGQYSHYVHKHAIAESVVNGSGMRALCGRYFVQTQPPEDRDVCPDCSNMATQVNATPM